MTSLCCFSQLPISRARRSAQMIACTDQPGLRIKVFVIARCCRKNDPNCCAFASQGTHPESTGLIKPLLDQLGGGLEDRRSILNTRNILNRTEMCGVTALVNGARPFLDLVTPLAVTVQKTAATQKPSINLRRHV